MTVTVEWESANGKVLCVSSDPSTCSLFWRELQDNFTKMSAKNAHGRIEELFIRCSAINPGSVEFPAVARVLWPILDNRASLVDLAGIFSMAIPPSAQSEAIDSQLFADIVNAIAKLKYPTSKEYVEKLLDDLKAAKPLPNLSENSFFVKSMDKLVLKSLLKFDIPIRRAYANFAGKAVSAGGAITWEEVKRLNLTMETDGFISFAGAFSLIPALLELKQCEALFKDIASSYSTYVASQSYGTVILFPQFQLLLCNVAFESNKIRFAERQTKASSKYRAGADSKDEFAKKTLDLSDTNLGDLLADFLKKLGIDKTEKTANFFSPSISTMQPPPKPSVSQRAVFEMDDLGSGKLSPSMEDSPLSPGASPVPADDGIASNALDAAATAVGGAGHASAAIAPASADVLSGVHTYAAGMLNPSGSSGMLGAVTLPLPNARPRDNMFEGSSSASNNHGRQAMQMRMDHLMDEVESEMLRLLGAGSEVLQILAQPSEENTEVKPKPTSKPVVIADAVAFPEACPDSIEQLLEAALAHHNVGSYEESLKFLEATRIQLMDIQKRILSGEKVPGTMLMSVLDVELYIIICKGNVYQSCGDDEQSMIQYLDGWNKAKATGNYDWEIVFLNAIGMLAYYNLRFDVGLMCFSAVTKYRSSSYGNESADTATAANNEACCLFCLHRKAEARVRFERSWNILCATLGHRSPRAVAVWKNMEKARRSHGAMMTDFKNIKDSIELRPDASKLLYGAEFFIKASVPEEGKKKKKGKKGKKKK